MKGRRSGLGRGLDALLPASPPEEEGSGNLLEIPVDSLSANPRQPREGFDEDQMRELVASVKMLGILQPVLVRANPAGGYELVAGERRRQAARAAGLETVPALVIETDETGSLERALVENLHREDLNPIEEAAAYRQLLDEGGLTHEELGRRLGRSRVTITNSLRLLDLPTDIQRSLVEDKLTAAHGRVLLSLQGNPFQSRLVRRIVGESLSVREAEEIARRYREVAATPKDREQAAPRTAAVVEAQRLLSDHLQTRVRVDIGKKRGRIVVHFATPDELDRLMKVITGAGGAPPQETVAPDRAD